MKLSWSHAVLNVGNLEKMLDFYMNTLGFDIADRGPLAENAPEIVFLSNDPDEHHQIAMVAMRKDDAPPNTLNHLAFRIENFADIRSLNAKLVEQAVKVLPLSHGNTLSLYFNDPEGNGLEVFWDTPWHVAQPQGEVWDPALDEAAALSWVESTFEREPTFARSEEAGSVFVNRHRS